MNTASRDAWAWNITCITRERPLLRLTVNNSCTTCILESNGRQAVVALYDFG
jgi:hypothetical protein